MWFKKSAGATSLKLFKIAPSMFRLLWCAAAFSRAAAVSAAAVSAAGSAKVQQRRILIILTPRIWRQKSEKTKVRVSDAHSVRELSCLII